ncbi:MAG: PAS domain-containing protein [Vulcanimicrobiota bacterium]
MKKDPIQLQAAFFEEVYEKRNVDAVFRYFEGTADGLGVAEPLDPVAYLDFYNALTSVVKDIRFDILDFQQQDGRLFVDFVMKARSRLKDGAVFWRCAGWAHYREGKMSQARNFLDFVDLFRQVGLVPEQAVELGLAGHEILTTSELDQATPPEVRRLFWPNFRAGVAQGYLPSEEEFEVLLQSATGGVVVSDGDQTILEVNQALANLLATDPTQLSGHRFSSLVAGKGREAEARAAAAVLSGQQSSYRLQLQLQAGQSPRVKAWVSALRGQRDGRPVLLRSVQASDLLDHLAALQETERQLLLTELHSDIIEPVLDLWRKLRPQAAVDPRLRQHCLELVGRLAGELRAKVAALRNPILEGVPLSQAWPEQPLDPALDQVAPTCALIAYRLVDDCLTHLDASLPFELGLEAGRLHGRLRLGPNPPAERLQAMTDRCALVGGTLSLEETALSFELPVTSIASRRPRPGGPCPPPRLSAGR